MLGSAHTHVRSGPPGTPPMLICAFVLPGQSGGVMLNVKMTSSLLFSVISSVVRHPVSLSTIGIVYSPGPRLSLLQSMFVTGGSGMPSNSHTQI